MQIIIAKDRRIYYRFFPTFRICLNCLSSLSLLQTNSITLGICHIDPIHCTKPFYPLRKILGQGIKKYKSLFPHVSAAIQLASEGKSVTIGEDVKYIFTNAGHNNPLYRVIPMELVEKKVDYDKEKYRDMLLEAAETVLVYFGFDRSIYGDVPKKKMKWWQHLHQEKLRGRDTETI